MPPPSAPLSTKLKVQLKLSVARLKMVQSRDASSPNPPTAPSPSSSRPANPTAPASASSPSSAPTSSPSSTRSSSSTASSSSPASVYSTPPASLAPAPPRPRQPRQRRRRPVCDPGLEEAVKSLIYAATRTEIKELLVLRTLFGEKFGKDFLIKAGDGVAGGLVDGYLEEIARAYNVDWPHGRLSAPEQTEEDDFDLLIDVDDDDDGAGDEGGGGGGANDLADLELLSDSSPAKSPDAASPPRPRPRPPTFPSEDVTTLAQSST
ncbi:unnamed protein product [Parascedosporium putredinis]|uniref:Uncharacterized protein n=1 Tax=Parascedosporium putredinis TaxID=1442378 RepID=A0A9P1M6X1_9PEZI|nr:unnamed protein product [Parascedosporium putredinis]CAI7987777.1 unnamed protein product [Parascedosporium putredinis]